MYMRGLSGADSVPGTDPNNIYMGARNEGAGYDPANGGPDGLGGDWDTLTNAALAASNDRTAGRVTVPSLGVYDAVITWAANGPTAFEQPYPNKPGWHILIIRDGKGGLAKSVYPNRKGTGIDALAEMLPSIGVGLVTGGAASALFQGVGLGAEVATTAATPGSLESFFAAPETSALDLTNLAPGSLDSFYSTAPTGGGPMEIAATPDITAQQAYNTYKEVKGDVNAVKQITGAFQGGNTVTPRVVPNKPPVVVTPRPPIVSSPQINYFGSSTPTVSSPVAPLIHSTGPRARVQSGSDSTMLVIAGAVALGLLLTGNRKGR